MVSWNYLMVLLVMCFHSTDISISNSTLEVDPPKKYVELPTINVNVYMMGRDEIDHSISILIQENLDYMNEEFAGYIQFNFDQLFMDPAKAYLPDLFNGFRNNDIGPITELVGHSEIKGGVNIYLFDTYCEEGTDKALMGFTPSLRGHQEHYQASSPDFDRIFMAYDGLEDKTTMIHEMGHFLGLHHPWEMTPGNRYALGMKNEQDVQHNHM